MLCDREPCLPQPHEAIFGLFRTTLHFEKLCQAKGIADTKMVVFKSILSDPYVIVTCLTHVRRLYSTMFEMINLRTPYFERLVRRCINESCARWSSGADSKIDPNLIPLPEWVKDIEHIEVLLFACFKFWGCVMIHDLNYLTKYMKLFIRNHKDDSYAAFMHFAKITQYACENGVSFQCAVAEPSVSNDWMEHSGKTTDPCTLFECLTDGSVNLDIISKMKTLSARQKLKNPALSLLDDSDFSSISDVDSYPDSVATPSPKKSKSQKKRAAKKKKDLAKAKKALKGQDSKDRQVRVNGILDRLKRTSEKCGGLKPQFAKAAKTCCEIFLVMGNCPYDKSTGICGKGTSKKHRCVCGGGHRLTKCPKQPWRDSP